MLNLKNISKKYGNKIVLKDINLQIGAEIKVLIGINGCGKSTLLKIISGIINADTGNILLNDSDISKLMPENRQIGYVPQHSALFNHKSVIENIKYGMRNGRGSEENLNKIINMLDLGEILNRKPNELSGGYKSRVSLARALAPSPRIMLLDEPLSDIDVVVKDRMLSEFRNALKQLKIPVLYVTHDPAEAEKLGDKFAIMVDGEIQEISSASEAFNLIKANALNTIK